MDDLEDDPSNEDHYLEDDIVDENQLFGDEEFEEDDQFLDEIEEDLSNLHIEREDQALEETLFDPPLYKQRYHAVAKEINRVNAKRVLDIGCSEGQFLPVVKAMCLRVQDISGVDIDLSLLERMSHKLRPLSIEYVLKRENPLVMRLLHGSITRPAHDFVGVDFVSCIEVIEHLMPGDLDQVPEAIFDVMKPKTVAVTTPNSEYNVLFKEFSGMRHWDHKFEWTRKEFEDWCNIIVKTYPYKVKFSGIGEPPAGNASIGCCSQMALFTREPQHPWLKVLREPDERTQYEVVHEFVYPYDSRSRREKLLNEIRYLVNRFYSNEGEEEEESFTREIALAELLEYPGMKRFEPERDELVDILQNSDIEYDLSGDGEHLIVHFRQSDFANDWEDGDDEDIVAIGDELGDGDGEILTDDDEEDWSV